MAVRNRRQPSKRAPKGALVVNGFDEFEVDLPFPMGRCSLTVGARGEHLGRRSAARWDGKGHPDRAGQLWGSAAQSSFVPRPGASYVSAVNRQVGSSLAPPPQTQAVGPAGP